MKLLYLSTSTHHFVVTSSRLLTHSYVAPFTGQPLLNVRFIHPPTPDTHNVILLTIILFKNFCISSYIHQCLLTNSICSNVLLANSFYLPTFSAHLVLHTQFYYLCLKQSRLI